MGKLGLGSFGMALNVSDTYLDEPAELERLGYSAITDAPRARRTARHPAAIPIRPARIRRHLGVTAGHQCHLRGPR
jgi:hypothetical protein